MLRKTVQRLGKTSGVYLLLLVAASIALSTFMYGQSGSDQSWPCSPLDPSADTSAQNNCFRAVLSEDNLLTLEWRVTSSVTAVYIYDDTAASYQDIGSQAPVCLSGPDDGCSTSLRVEQGGFYRWVIRAEGHREEVFHARTSILVKSPFPPTVSLQDSFADMLRPQARTFVWLVDPRNDFPNGPAEAWVEVLEPGQFFWNGKMYPREQEGNAYIVPAEQLQSPGDIYYKVRDCTLPTGSQRKFCSAAVTVGLRVGADHFISPNHVHVSAGEDLEIQFTTRSGNLRLLSSETLIQGEHDTAFAYTSVDRYTIDGSLLYPGTHHVQLVSCRLPGWECSNRVDAQRAENDGTLWHKQAGHYKKGELIAAVIAQDMDFMQMILSPDTGDVFFSTPQNIAEVKAGDLVAYVITPYGDELSIVVDSPVNWERGRDYTLDFYPGKALPILGAGQALDITFDQHGGIWALNEFSNNLEHVTPGGLIETLDLPMGRASAGGTGALAPVRPFTFWWLPNAQGNASASSLAERVTMIDGKIWLTQGGGLQLNGLPSGQNHSRIVSYDPSAEDRPDTVYDDRFCVYNIPTDDTAGLGNNQIIGLTAARGRIWFTESRGLLNDQTSYLSSFIPDAAHCENLLNFNEPGALQAQLLQYCGIGRTPEQDRCVEKIPLPGLPKQIKAAHVEADPVDETVWFTDACGKCLGHYNLWEEGAPRFYEFADQHSTFHRGVEGMGGFPWNLQVDNDAVYVGEYSTRHILRFDKASGEYDEIHIPYANLQVNLHSLALDKARQRLWFTLSNETPAPINTAASTIGYVDIASWGAHIADPIRNPVIAAVTYRGLENIPGSDYRAASHQSFRGIAIDPRSGKIGLATMWREQITLLKPLPGFWP